MAQRQSKVRQVDVLGTRYAVRRVPAGHPGLTDSEGGTDNHGMHVADEPALYLDETLGPERERLTLSHELSHAIEHHFGMDLSEEIVEAYGKGILYLIRHNPPLVRFLQRADVEVQPD